VRIYLWFLGNRLYARVGRRTVFLGNLANNPATAAIRLVKLLGAVDKPIQLRRVLRLVAAAVGSALRLVKAGRCRDSPRLKPRLWEVEALLEDAAHALSAVSPALARTLRRCLERGCGWPNG